MKDYANTAGQISGSNFTPGTYSQKNISNSNNPTAKFLDGITRRKPTGSQQKVDLRMQKTEQKPSVEQKKIVNTIPHDTSRTFIRTNKSRTLLRSIVKKPLSDNKINSQINKIPETRLQKAANNTKSNQINRFNSSAYKGPTLVNNLAVSKTPSQTTKYISSSPPISAFTQKYNQTQPNSNSVFSHPVVASNIAYRKHSRTKMSRLVIKHLKIKPKIAGLATACLAILFLSAFFAYQYIPSVAIRVAANKAGFDAKLPSGMPPGYSFRGPIEVSEGTITLKYKSNSDERQFFITQKPTSWSSDALLSQYVLASKLPYQTFTDQGLTVFIYSHGDATWVDKGLWYRLSDQGSLSSDQILAIASNI